jgi:XTP/dITP diphosphohydrolase
MPSLTTIVLATGNLHKVAEIRAILGGQFRFLTLGDFPGAPKVVEDAPTFAGNAAKKSLALARFSAIKPGILPAFILADDSGLEVDALNGAPGVYSARFAALDKGDKGNSSDAENRAKLWRLLQNVPAGKRTARFRCVVAFTPVRELASENASPVCYAEELELETELFEGTCEGEIGFSEKGQGGFGYDSLFIPKGYSETFGELPEEQKNRISHRARALAKLQARFREDSLRSG